MARNELWIDADPCSVFGIVADPQSYAHWVVGATRVDGIDERWPQPGATFRHRQAKGPMAVHDTTSVLQCDAPHRLLLEVRARPWFIGRVELTYQPERNGTRIVLREHPVGGVARAVPALLLDPLLRARNTETIRRLGAMAWSRQHARDEPARAATAVSL